MSLAHLLLFMSNFNSKLQCCNCQVPVKSLARVCVSFPLDSTGYDVTVCTCPMLVGCHIGACTWVYAKQSQ